MKRNLVFFNTTNKEHFMPTLSWPNNYAHSSGHRKLEDKTTGLHFMDDHRNLIRFKCLLLTIISVPLIHVILCILQTAFNLLKILYDIFKIIINGRVNFSENVANLVWDLAKLIIAPLLVIALEITATLGLLFPLNARKIYSSIERAMTNDLFEIHTYLNKKSVQSEFEGNKAITAPCFQPKLCLREPESVEQETNIIQSV